MQFSMNNKVHIFDCDGVLLDSNEEKVKALISSLQYVDCPKNFIDWAASMFRKNFGRSRQAHFSLFKGYDGVKGYRLSASDADRALKYYGDKVVSIYDSCNLINETVSYIERITINEKIFVVSASDQVELRDILPVKIPKIKDINIFGGPKSKVDNINKIMNLFPRDSIVFYGDAVQDAKAAIFSGISFVGLNKYSAAPELFRIFCSDNNLTCLSTLNQMDIQ